MTDILDPSIASTIVSPVYTDESGVTVPPWGASRGDSYSTRSASADGSYLASDGIIDFDCSAGNINYQTVHMSSVLAGRLFGAKKIAGDNIVTLTDPDGALLDDETEIRLVGPNEGIWFSHDGTQWRKRGTM